MMRSRCSLKNCSPNLFFLGTFPLPSVDKTSHTMALLAVPSVRLVPRVVVARRCDKARRARSHMTRAAFVDQPGDDAGPSSTSTKQKPPEPSADIPNDEISVDDETYVESDEEVRERTAVGALVKWCVERGASGSGLSVRLPDDSLRGRGLEASRDIEVDEIVLSLPLEMGICDAQEGHPAETWDTMANAPWGVRLACRVLQERAKGVTSEYAPYLELIPESVPGSPLLYADDQVLGLQYPPAVNEAREMRTAVKMWHGILKKECPSALAGATYDDFKSAVSVVHSRTYGIAGESGEGYFRALLPLADLLNHAGDEYLESASFLSKQTNEVSNTDTTESNNKNSMWPPAHDSDNLAWSTVDDSGVINFAATKEMKPGSEASMSYGERSNDHFLMYYGFTPPRNPHDDVIIFQDLEHALSWHMVFHPELWDTGSDEEANVREDAARAAVKATEKLLAQTKDGELMMSEPRLKVLPGGRCDARLVSLFAAAYAGNDAGVESGKEIMEVDIQSAHLDIAKRCAELLRQMPTSIAEDSELLCSESIADATRSMVSYRAHKKEVLVDAITELGKGGVEMPEAYR